MALSKFFLPVSKVPWSLAAETRWWSSFCLDSGSCFIQVMSRSMSASSDGMVRLSHSKMPDSSLGNRLQKAGLAATSVMCSAM